MTLNFAPWAIDGARTAAGLARLSSYAGGGGRSGVIRPSDLRVSALAVPGQGVRLTAGGASILNGYLTDPDESYVVSNPASHTVLAADMPGSQPSTAYYLVCIVVGDPEFDQTGHPFMPAGTLDPVVALDYEYVRVVVLTCSPTDTHFDDLGVSYPGIALARLEVPPSTTTITNAMITDVRELSKPRYSNDLLVGRQTATKAADDTNSPGGAWTTLVDFLPTIEVPTWATRMKILTTVTAIGGTSAADNALTDLRTVVSGVAGSEEHINIDGGARTIAITGYDADVSPLAGTSIALSVQARQVFTQISKAFVDSRTQVIYDVRFFENVL